jgi:hypothetical protein
LEGVAQSKAFILSVFSATVKYMVVIHGGQDHAFQFRCGLTNNKAHSDLSWFRSLLGDNSPTSNGLILKMNRCYKGVSKELSSSCDE